MNTHNNLFDIYEAISNRLNLINFNKLWNGFKPYKFAIYNDEFVVFEGKKLPKNDQFIGNTSIEFNNEQIAIWKITDNDDDLDVLTSKIVHEMFHAYQMNNNETRFPKEFEAVVKYKYNKDNLNIKLAENLLLIELLEEFNMDKFNLFLSYRCYRKNLDQYSFNYEASIEVIEGSANYVEFKALEQLNCSKAISFLNQMRTKIINQDNFIPIRIISYDIGAIILKIIKDNQIPFDDTISKEQDLYIDQLLVNTNKLIKPIVPDIFSNIIKREEDKLQTVINEVTQTKPVITGNYKLSGFNVYDGRYYSGFLFTSYFLGYQQDNETPIFLNGNFLVEMNEEFIISKIYKWK